MKPLIRKCVRAICRCYPLYSGRGTIANTGVFRRLSEMSEPEVTTTLHDGSKIVVPMDDYIGRSIYYFGDLDFKVSWVCKQVLRPGDTVIDIGAHFGIVSLYTAALVGTTGKVHAFEPHPLFADRIRRSLQLNQCPQVVLHNIALSDQNATMTLSVPHDNSGRSTLLATHRPSDTVEITARNTSEYFEGLDLEKIRLLKIDVEGHEAEVFQGGKSFLKKTKPDVIVFEEHKKPIWEQPVTKLLEELGYEIYAIPRTKMSVHTHAIKHRDEDSQSLDYVAIHPKSEDPSQLRAKLRTS